MPLTRPGRIFKVGDILNDNAEVLEAGSPSVRSRDRLYTVRRFCCGTTEEVNHQTLVNLQKGKTTMCRRCAGARNSTTKNVVDLEVPKQDRLTLAFDLDGYPWPNLGTFGQR